jgi:hypothetical protein
MRETAAGYRARTGRSYRAAAAGRPLADDEVCPTLFRYPGAAALLEALSTRLARLGPPDEGTLWLCEDASAVCPGGVGRFGALAVLRPLELGAAALANGVFAAENRDVGGDAVVWIPPRLVTLGPDLWDDVAEASAAERVLGERWHEERAEVVRALSGYLEELEALSRAGARLPRRWSEMTGDERRSLLAAHGVPPRWT